MKYLLALMVIYFTSCTMITMVKKKLGSNTENNKNSLVCNDWLKDNSNGLSVEAIKEILDVHNDYRNRIASGNAKSQDFKLPKANNMIQMMWSSEIAQKAQAHANKCRFSHSTSQFRNQPNFPTGENLYTSSSYPSFKGMDWKKAIDAWYSEINNLQEGDVQSFNVGDQVTGHFTQVVWANSYMVGCGFAQYSEDDWKTNLYVCEYGPVGNILETPIYNSVGDDDDTCNCIGGMQCSSEKFSKLCCKKDQCRSGSNAEKEFILSGDEASNAIPGTVPEGLVR